jgi:hypothetical protein
MQAGAKELGEFRRYKPPEIGGEEKDCGLIRGAFQEKQNAAGKCLLPAAFRLGVARETVSDGEPDRSPVHVTRDDQESVSRLGSPVNTCCGA